jgi:hypothetical protein
MIFSNAALQLVLWLHSLDDLIGSLFGLVAHFLEDEAAQNIRPPFQLIKLARGEQADPVGMLFHQRRQTFRLLFKVARLLESLVHHL